MRRADTCRDDARRTFSVTRQKHQEIAARFFPEIAAGGFTRIDGTVAFYSRINALISRSSVVVDFGAGRGQFVGDSAGYRRDLCWLKGRVQRVIGLDIDDIVLENPALDESHLIIDGRRLPLVDGSADLIVSDFTFEHVKDPGWLAEELSRILKSGGWICARTPNKWGYIAVFARLVPNRFHDAVLRVVQPRKKSIDTFPTLYRLNTRRDLLRYFPVHRFEHIVFEHDAEPAYAASSILGWTLGVFLNRISPRRVRSMLFIFLRKKD
jgi:SAM-dependent methyltransferase